ANGLPSSGYECLSETPNIVVDEVYDAVAADIDENGEVDFIAAARVSTGDRLVLWINPTGLTSPSASVRINTYLDDGMRCVDVGEIYNRPNNSGLDVVGGGSAAAIWFESNGGPFGETITDVT